MALRYPRLCASRPGRVEPLHKAKEPMMNSMSFNTMIAATARACLATTALCLVACANPGAAASAPPAVLSPFRVASIVGSSDRSDADRINDIRRKPVEMLNFIGIRPGMVALDVSAGGGYTTELLARAVGPGGRVYGQSPPPAVRPAPAASEGAASPMATPAAGAASTPPAAPRRTSAMALAERAKNPNASNIVAVVQPFENPVPVELASNGLDLVTLMFNYHDLGYLGVDRAKMNRALFAALKPGGIYVVADHSGRPGTGISESGTLHRIEEAFLRSEVESAGFRLAESADFLRNPGDPRDRNTPEPPQPKDEFVLKFVKP
jgi:predicted methyltransferase